MQNKIVLFAKQPGKTSFSSLFTIKHALNTNKVGHTGTLDSFAQGLLVVCAGSLTRLAGKITEFDKSYKAVISFGQETDTLECTGKVVKEAPLPTKERVEEAVKFFTGTYMQKPPLFSAIHVDGKRASDEIRSGKKIDIPAREVTVFSSEINEYLIEDSCVKAVLVDFHVSKGTYIRSLARDIAERAGSASYLSGLFRTKVGNFSVEDAAGFSLLQEFNIENVLKTEEKLKVLTENTFSANAKGKTKEPKKAFILSEEERRLQEEVLEKSEGMKESLALECGFGILKLVEGQEEWFYNGGKLSSKMFTSSPFEVTQNMACVFNQKGDFSGLLEKDSNGYFKYSFVVH